MRSCWRFARAVLRHFRREQLFVAGGAKDIYETLVKVKVPFPRQTAYLVSGVEFAGGSLLTLGLLSSPACVALLIDMIVAVLTNALSTMPKGLSPLNWLDDFLYLPEVPSSNGLHSGCERISGACRTMSWSPCGGTAGPEMSGSCKTSSNGR
jgi:uncharacterized membrane protein YphA (DoxX/SURF4 family)